MPERRQQLSRRQMYRRRRFAAVLLIVLLLFVSYVSFALLLPASTTAPRVAAPALATPAAAAPVYPSYGASAFGAVGYGNVLGSGGTSAQLPMASITKIITALVVLKAKPLAKGDEGPAVTMTAQDVGYYTSDLSNNGSVKPVKAGWAFTEHELLELALIPSADNYATTLAVFGYGSQSAYLTAARAWLTSKGLTGITLRDTSGLDPASTATASDLVKLGEIALTNPVLADIVDEKGVTVPNVGEIDNTNKLLGHNGVVGIKTGTLTLANLLFASRVTIGGTRVTIVGVVLGGKTHPILDHDVRTLLASAKEGFHSVTLAKKGQTYATYTSKWGGTSTVVASRTVTKVVWSNTPVSQKVDVFPTLPAAAGHRVGQVTVTAGVTTASVPLVLADALVGPGGRWRLAHPFG